jgi:hypothetical protein
LFIINKFELIKYRSMGTNKNNFDQISNIVYFMSNNRLSDLLLMSNFVFVKLHVPHRQNVTFLCFATWCRVAGQETCSRLNK